MSAIPVVVAFVLGLAARQVGLPPLVGFLLAGFALHAGGVEGGAALEWIADLGVYLLLFTIGLKLRLRSLARPEIWGVASLHMALVVAGFGAGLWGLGAAGFPLVRELDGRTALLLAFALSFSSTVFAVKVLEEKGDTLAFYGRVAIGILIVQDLFAIVFLTASTGKLPSAWALGLLALPLARPMLSLLMSRCGHGELLVLLGLLLALGAAELFEAVGMKPDLGPLLVGVLAARHPNADEMAKRMLGFKDLFLTGFFVSIGLKGVPGAEALAVAVLLVAIVPVKAALFFVLLTAFRTRARSACFASLSLANYSEFGLIVAAVGASQGWIAEEWLVILAVALSISFLLAAPCNESAQSLYSRVRQRLSRFERPGRLPDEQTLDPGAATIAVVGMGRVGTGAYDFMRARFGETVVGVDYDQAAVKRHTEAGRHVILGDVRDADFWERLPRTGQMKLVLLTMGNHAATLAAAERLVEESFPGAVAATAEFPDELEALRRVGVDAALDLYAEAGTGFAEHVCASVETR